MERASALTMFPAPAAPLTTYTLKPYTGRGRSLKRGSYSHKRGGRDRDHDRSAPKATITKSGDGQTTMTGAEEIGNRQNEGVPPPTISARQFVEGWKCITNDPYMLSIVAKGYRYNFTSPRPHGKYDLPGAPEDSMVCESKYP